MELKNIRNRQTMLVKHHSHQNGYLMKKRLRLWYPAGAISLILLPVFCLLYFKHRGIFEKPHAMKVYCMEEPRPKPSSLDFVPLKRQDFEIILDGDDLEAKIKLDFARVFVRQMVSEQDTVNGIRFKFTEKAKYWMFVRALDLCKIEKVQHFVTLENDIRAYYVAPEKVDSANIIRPVKFCGFGDDIAIQFDQKRRIERQMQHYDFLRSLWPVGLLFMLMVVLAFHRIRSNIL